MPILCSRALLSPSDRFVSKSSRNYSHSICQAREKLKKKCRWDDEEGSVLSTCSKFDHFRSGRSYLTSPRLAWSPHGDTSQFNIHLRSHEHAADSRAKGSPLVRYAAQHWVGYARFENDSSRVRHGIDYPFGSSWLRGSRWTTWTTTIFSPDCWQHRCHAVATQSRRRYKRSEPLRQYTTAQSCR